MQTTIDKAGRVVIPKAARDALGLQAGVKLDVTVRDGHIEIEPTPVPMRLVERNGIKVLEADGPMPRLTTEMVRDVLEQVRR